MVIGFQLIIQDNNAMDEMIRKRIREIICKNIDLVAIDDTIDENEKLIDLGMNSLVFIQIIVCIEEEFQIEFEPEVMLESNFESINHFVNYIRRKIES